MEADTIQDTSTNNYFFEGQIKDEEICEECGLHHSFRPTFEEVKTSIEIIPVLIEKLLKREQSEQEGIVV